MGGTAKTYSVASDYFRICGHKKGQLTEAALVRRADGGGEGNRTLPHYLSFFLPGFSCRCLSETVYYHSELPYPLRSKEVLLDFE